MAVLKFRRGNYFFNLRGIKEFTCRIAHKGGRNNRGVITVRHRGFFSRRIYRVIDHNRVMWNMTGTLIWIEVDPNRNCYIGLFEFLNKLVSYYLLPAGLRLNSVIHNGALSLGSAMYLRDMPLGSYIHNVGGKFLRSAGTKGQIYRKSKLGIVTIRTRTTQKDHFLYVNENRIGVLGTVSNIEFKLQKLRKAGDSRRLGIRPHVRGVAMNPVDHPHGGGEGKTSGGRLPVTPWGKLTKGKVTLTRKKRKHFEIIKRRSL
jgi:large subunit ribosomal protein L2